MVTGTVRSGTVTAGVRSAAIAGDLGIDRDTVTVTRAAVRVPAGPHWHHDASAAGSVIRLRVSPGLAATAALKLSLAAALLAPVTELSEARNLKFVATMQRLSHPARSLSPSPKVALQCVCHTALCFPAC